MARFRMYPTGGQERQMLLHCAHARYVWNLAVEQHAHWRRWRRSAPGFAEQCRQLTAARRDNEWLGSGNADVQQQALKDFARPSRRVSRPGSVSRPGVGSMCTRALGSSAPTASPDTTWTARRS
ncbi:helix-turn-helix domain-containing protein [Streptomyces sp900129855]|uniref:Helix-turn-helix domain-containing protein n=1 Tax=Streptomyces sp. 900129855 TaxID=3155129 RepID=A0ABV2ZTT0_9ACTN